MPQAVDRTDTSERFEREAAASHALWERALGSLPGGNTRTTIFQTPHPLYLVRGAGCRVTDADGVERVDFINNYTSLAHGHCHPPVVRAVQEQAERLMGVAGSNELEVELAEQIRARVPSIDLLRYTNSGTEATAQAIRGARAFTGRTTVLVFAGGYHGPHDYGSAIPAVADKAPGGAGIPSGVSDTLVVAPFNDLEGTRAAIGPRLDDLAAILVEPVMGSAGVIAGEPAFLQGLRELADEAGALLVFDEVIAFRVGYHGAQGHCGIRPDLTTLGKIIGGGLPVGAFGGRGDVMELYDPRSRGRLVHGGTFNGNPLTTAAGLATLADWTPAAVARLEALAVALRTKLEALFADAGLTACVTQIGSLFNIHFTGGPIRDSGDVLAGNTALLRDLHLALLGHGVLFTPRGMGCLSTPMGEAEIDAFVEATRRALGDLGVG